ncbi:MAG: Gfo/Idh/MocA family oxidoreductase [Thaumarchaeota archaeon]|nr:Gfo/Idh/MocA family oxidoreductase [Nitrososphaerota archaeon]
MNIAVAGVGMWGENHVKALKSLEDEGYDVHLQIVLDADLARAKLIAEKYGVKQHTSDLEEVLRSDVKAIHVVTPPSTHYSVASRCMKSGKHVLVEKPLATSAADALKLVELAEETGLTLQVGHLFRYHSAVKELKKLIGEDALGRVLYLLVKRLDFRKPREDSGVLWNLAIHDVDLFAYLLDKPFPTQVETLAANFFGSDIDVLTVLKADYGEVFCLAYESWVSPLDDKSRTLLAVGDKASALIDFISFNVTLTSTAMSSKQFTIDTKNAKSYKVQESEPLKTEIIDFLECCKTGRKPVADGEAGYRSVQVIEKALKSVELGRSVECP